MILARSTDWWRTHRTRRLDNSWLVNMSKAVSPAGMPLVTGSNRMRRDWLKAFRHDMTFGSRAVLADVKNGGLRRDLSLAFEMDGNRGVRGRDSF